MLSRSLKIVDYGDEFTKREFLSRSERCVVFIPPASVFRAGEIIGMLEEKSLRIINLKMMRFISDELKSLLDNYTSLSNIPTLLNELTGKQLIALEVMGTNVCSLLYEFIYGPKGTNKIFGNPGGPNFHEAALLKNTTLCVIRPYAVSDGLTGKIWSAINEKGFCVTAARLYRLSKAGAADFLEVYKGVVQEYPEMLDQLSSGPCIALEIDIPDPQFKCPSSFPGVHWTNRPTNKIFGNPGGPNFHEAALLKNTTLCVIRPYAVSDGLTGKIWSAINEKGFCVTAARLYRLSKAGAADFLEVYKGVVQEYPEMLDQLSSGPSFREFTGPIDPEIAKYLRPDTLRARFGVTKVKNAIHCTDLPEDTEREVNYFFNNLDK
ncbi:unnamed protein product [Schistosoma rodhaini]|nr:unnamed protein product [Schistosoma rodhaini]